MVKIKLTRTGRKNAPAYRIAVFPDRTKRDSRAIEFLGHFSPISKELVINSERSKYWLSVGAQPTDRVAQLLSKEGIIAKKDLPKFNRHRAAGKKAAARVPAEPVVKDTPKTDTAAPEADTKSE